VTGTVVFGVLYTLTMSIAPLNPSITTPVECETSQILHEKERFDVMKMLYKITTEQYPITKHIFPICTYPCMVYINIHMFITHIETPATILNVFKLMLDTVILALLCSLLFFYCVESYRKPQYDETIAIKHNLHLRKYLNLRIAYYQRKVSEATASVIATADGTPERTTALTNKLKADEELNSLLFSFRHEYPEMRF
jgi:hypothetical protein